MTVYRTKLGLFLIILSFCTLGLFRILVTPAWNNTEEPNHFEVALRIARDGRLTEADYPVEPSILNTFVASHPYTGMLGPILNRKVRDYWGINQPSDWNLPYEALRDSPGYYDARSGPDRPGASQFDEPPGYYYYLALWLLPFRQADAITQLYITRIATLMLGVPTLLFAFLSTRELLPNDRVFHLGIPALLVVTHAVTTDFTAINNTALAVLAYTFALWAAVKIQSANNRAIMLIPVALAAILIIISKPTAYVGLILLAGATALAFLPPRYRVRGSLLAAVVPLIAFFLFLVPQGARSWYPISDGNFQIDSQAPDGKHVSSPNSLTWQPLSRPTIEELAGQEVTVGAWIRADRIDVSQASLPQLWLAPLNGEFTPTTVDSVHVSDSWRSYSYTISVPAQTYCMFLAIPASEGIRYDAILVTTESRDGLIAASGVSNPSFERPWHLLPRRVVDVLPEQIGGLGVSLNLRLANLQDPTNLPQLVQTSRYYFSTFWGRFAWGIPVYPQPIVFAAGLLTLVNLAGLGVALGKNWRSWSAEQRMSFVLFGAAGCLVILVSLLRIDGPRFRQSCSLTQGRFVGHGYYNSPAFFPILALWGYGMFSWMNKRIRRVALSISIVVMYMLSMYVVLTIQLPIWLTVYGMIH